MLLQKQHVVVNFWNNNSLTKIMNFWLMKPKMQDHNLSMVCSEVQKWWEIMTITESSNFNYLWLPLTRNWLGNWRGYKSRSEMRNSVVSNSSPNSPNFSTCLLSTVYKCQGRHTWIAWISAAQTTLKKHKRHDIGAPSNPHSLQHQYTIAASTGCISATH